jgi:hypothetical protein
MCVCVFVCLCQCACVSLCVPLRVSVCVFEVHRLQTIYAMAVQIV